MQIPKKIYIPIYLIILLGLFGLVYFSLQGDEVKIVEKQKNESVEDIKPIDISFNYQINNKSASFRIKMKNSDTVYDLLDKIRKEQNLQFEIVECVNQTQIILVLENQILSYENICDNNDDHDKLLVEVDGNEITSEIKSIKLGEDKTYYLKEIE